MIIKERMTASMEDDFVVFLIGMRINQPWKIHKWLPAGAAMPRMLKELYQNPEMGLIHHEMWFGRTTIMVQYWKSMKHLLAYAHDKNSEHLPAWTFFNRTIGSDGTMGIWHETYVIPKGNYECVYNNMPPFGLGKAGKLEKAQGHLKSAAGRLQKG